MPRIASSERRVLLVQAALRVIAAHGVSAATTRAIVAEADMSLASFHYAFRSHDEMMRELVAYVVGTESTAAASVLRPGRDIRESLRYGLRAYLDLLIADPGHEQVLQELMQYSLRTPGLEGMARDQYASYLGAVEQLLVEGARAGAVEWSVPVTDVARLVVAVTNGFTHAWLANRDAEAAIRVIDFAADAVAALAVPAARAGARPTPEPIRSVR